MIANAYCHVSPRDISLLPPHYAAADDAVYRHYASAAADERYAGR